MTAIIPPLPADLNDGLKPKRKKPSAAVTVTRTSILLTDAEGVDAITAHSP